MNLHSIFPALSRLYCLEKGGYAAAMTTDAKRVAVEWVSDLATCELWAQAKNSGYGRVRNC
jgi:hypothetical protein